MNKSTNKLKKFTTDQYYAEQVQNARVVLGFSLFLITAGFSVVVFCIIFAVVYNNVLIESIGAISGVVVIFFGGTIFKIYASQKESTDKYYGDLLEKERLKEYEKVLNRAQKLCGKLTKPDKNEYFRKIIEELIKFNPKSEHT